VAGLEKLNGKCIALESLQRKKSAGLPDNSQFSPLKYLGQMQRYLFVVNPFRQVPLLRQGLLEQAF